MSPLGPHLYSILAMSSEMSVVRHVGGQLTASRKIFFLSRDSNSNFVRESFNRENTAPGVVYRIKSYGFGMKSVGRNSVKIILNTLHKQSREENAQTGYGYGVIVVVITTISLGP